MRTFVDGCTVAWVICDDVAAAEGLERRMKALKGAVRKTLLHDLFRDQLKRAGGVKFVRSTEPRRNGPATWGFAASTRGA